MREDETMTIVEFLLARIDEDEDLARLADDVTDKVEDDWQDVTQPITHAKTQGRPQESWAERYGHAYQLISAMSPERVLAECEAKRRIVELHQSWPVLVETTPTFELLDSGDVSSITYRASQSIRWHTEQEYRARFGSEPPTAPMIAALAAVYADHPDYDEAWRPS